MPYDATALDQPINQLRLLIDDRDSTPRYSDDELDFFLEAGNVYLAAADVLEQMASGKSSDVSISVDGVSYSGGAAQQQLLTMAGVYRRRGMINGQVTPYIGGVSRAEHIKDMIDPDYIPLHVRSHMHDNPEALTRGSDNLIHRPEW